jgi:hypothetical protein
MAYKETLKFLHLLLIKKNHSMEKKSRAGGKNKPFSGSGYQWEEEGTRKGGMRVYMVDVFCIHIRK